jgi:hypothetical protein
MRKRFLLLAGIFGAAVVGASFNFGEEKASATVPGTNALVSVNSSNTAANIDGTTSDGGSLSRNGRYFAFSSFSYNVVSSDTNNTGDVFVRDLKNGTTSRASVSSAGVEGDDYSNGERISETGRYIVFKSKASNLISGVTVPTTYYQTYLRDTQTNTTVWLSQNASGTAANNDVIPLDVSTDGRYVLLSSYANNLGPSVTNTGGNIYMLDRADNSFTILNYKYDGTLPNTNTNGVSASMSCDGSLVVLRPSASLTTAPSNHLNVFLLDRRAGNKITDVTAFANGSATAQGISCNGNYISFISNAYNIDPLVSSSPNYYHGYVYNRIDGTYHLVDKSSANTVGNNSINCGVYDDRCISVSDRGIVAFSSNSTNLTSTSVADSQIYVHNLESGVTDLLSVNSSGTAGNSLSSYPVIDSEGSIVGYDSWATNLATKSDSNNTTDVFTSLTGY